MILTMRTTAWTLLFALLLQVVAGAAWALQADRGSPMPAHCHEPVSAVAADDHSAADLVHARQPPLESHHCCAVGLGAGAPSPWLTLPRATPISQPAVWASLSLSPDLRPPI